MAIITTDSQHYTDIGNAIRAKGVSGSFTPAQMSSAIESIEGGNSKAYEEQTINFTLASRTDYKSVLDQYIDECAMWMIFPTDLNNTNTDTIATGPWYKSPWAQPSPLQNISTPVGAQITAPPIQYYINDVTYNSVRMRGNVNSKPAGDYCLKFYGIAI